jgi:hypothetical protein
MLKNTDPDVKTTDSGDDLPVRWQRFHGVALSSY